MQGVEIMTRGCKYRLPIVSPHWAL